MIRAVKVFIAIENRMTQHNELETNEFVVLIEDLAEDNERIELIDQIFK